MGLCNGMCEAERTKSQKGSLLSVLSLKDGGTNLCSGEGCRMNQ